MPEGYRIALIDLQPIGKQGPIIAAVKSKPDCGYAFLGRPGAGKTQIMYSLYLHESDGERWPHYFAVVGGRELIGQIREYELRPEQAAPPAVYAEFVRDCVIGKIPLSVYLDEFDRFGTASAYAMDMLHELVNELSRHHASGLLRFSLTSNLTSSGIQNKFGGSLYRRIEGLCEVVEFS